MVSISDRVLRHDVVVAGESAGPGDIADRYVLWDLIVGDPERYVPPGDPFMRESPEPRSGTNPITGAAIAPPSSTDPTANPINGHEQNYSGRDLQYACTFPLPEPLVCDRAREDSAQGCDCFENELPLNRPVCQPPGG